MKYCVLGLLVLLLSLCACSARPLGFGRKHADNNQGMKRNYEHNKLNQLLMTVMMRNSKAYEVQEVYHNESDGVIKTTFQASQERHVDAEKWKKEARRSTLQSLPHHKNNAKPEETMDSSNQNEGHDEEAVVMDYAQPHRKPPIHNREP